MAERRIADSLVKRFCRLGHEVHVRADPLHVVRVERQADGEQLVDDHGAKGGQKRSNDIDTASSCLGPWRLLPEDVGRRVEEARQEE